MVRTKFKVASVAPSPGMDGYTVTLFPVMSGSKENEQFYKYTPVGSITLSTINESAVEQFIPSKEFYVDFTEA